MAGTELTVLESTDLILDGSQEVDFIKIEEPSILKVADSFGLGSVMGLIAGAMASLMFVPDQVDLAFIVATSLFGGTGMVAGVARSTEKYVGQHIQELGHFNSVTRPKGLWKSFLPGGLKRHQHAYLFEGRALKPGYLQDAKQGINHPSNATPIRYTLKRVKGGVKVYSSFVRHPMEAWDKLYFDETGKDINNSRLETEEYYKNLSDPSVSDIVVAKMSRGLYRMRKKPVPLWLEDTANISTRNR